LIYQSFPLASCHPAKPTAPPKVYLPGRAKKLFSGVRREQPQDDPDTLERLAEAQR
jgi:hypothetical protein